MWCKKIKLKENDQAKNKNKQKCVGIECITNMKESIRKRKRKELKQKYEWKKEKNSASFLHLCQNVWNKKVWSPTPTDNNQPLISNFAAEYSGVEQYEVIDYATRISVDAQIVDDEDIPRRLPRGVPSSCKHIFVMALLENHDNKSVEFFFSCQSS